MEFKFRQVAFSDMLIVNKVDLVAAEEIERIRAWLDDRFDRYRLLEASGGDVPLEMLLSVGRFDPSRLDGTAAHDRPPIILMTITRSCSRPGPTNRASLCRWRRCGNRHAGSRPASTDARVWCMHEEPGRRTILQVVGKRVDIAAENEWKTAENRGPGSSSSAHMMEWTKLRRARSSTDAVRQYATDWPSCCTSTFVVGPVGIEPTT
jgi:G3E family GTPase